MAILSLCLSLSASVAEAVCGEHIWSERFGGLSNDSGRSMSPTADGGVLVTGFFRGTVDFGGGPLTSAGEHDVFVLKLGSDGHHEWSVRFGSAGPDFGYGVVATAEGGALVTGEFVGFVIFQGHLLISEGESDAFLLKLDADGKHVWSKRMGGPSSDQGLAVCAGTDGSFLVTGFFLGKADFGNTLLKSAGGSDAFISKLTSDGDFVWSKRAGGAAWDNGWSIASTTDGGALVAGDYEPTNDLGSQPDITSVPNIFVLKLAPDGTRIWERRFGGPGTDRPFCVSATPDGGALVTGDFVLTVDFGGGPLTSAGIDDIFVLRLASDGSHVWSKRFGGTSNDVGLSVSSTSDGSVVLTGYFHNTINFGGGFLTSLGSQDCFVLILASNGRYVWAERFGDTGQDSGRGVSEMNNQRIGVTGFFEGTVDFGGGPLTSAGVNDAFVMCLDGQCNDDPTAYSDGSTSGFATTASINTASSDVLVWPNPFHESTEIRWHGLAQGRAELDILDLQGRVVQSFAGELPGAFRWDGRDRSGHAVPNGIYFYQVRCGDWADSGKVIRLR